MTGVGTVEWIALSYAAVVVYGTPLAYRKTLRRHVSRRGAFWIGAAALSVAPGVILANSYLSGRYEDAPRLEVEPVIGVAIMLAVFYVLNAKAEGLLRKSGGAKKTWDFTEMRATRAAMTRRAPQPDWHAHTSDVAFLHTPDWAVVPLKFAMPAYCIRTTGDLAKLDEIVSRALDVERTDSTLYAEFGTDADERVRLWAASEGEELRIVVALGGTSPGHGAFLDTAGDAQAATELYREVARAVVSTADGYSQALAVVDAEELTKSALGFEVRPSKAKKVVLVILALVFVAVMAFGGQLIALFESWL